MSVSNLIFGLILLVLYVGVFIWWYMLWVFLGLSVGCSASHTGYFDGGFTVLSDSCYVIVGELASGAVIRYPDGVCLHGLTVFPPVIRGFPHISVNFPALNFLTGYMYRYIDIVCS